MRLVYVFRTEDPEMEYRFRMPRIAAWALSRMTRDWDYALNWWSQ